MAVIGENREITFYRELMELGLTEYLPRPLTRDMVLDQLRPKLLGDVAPGPTDRGGHVISICGAQGGAGATSIAINLALQLAETTKAKVALLDLHLQGGETAVMLGVRPGPGLRIALENPMRADTLFLERAAIEVNERVCLISADEELDAQLDITEAGVRHVLGLLRQRFNYIVVDVPVPFPPSIHPVITLSRHVLVLLEAEVTGLRNAHALRAAVTNIAGKDRVFTLLNRADRAGGLPRAMIVKALGAEPDMVIPDLGKGMTQAVNLGIPALKHVRKLRRHLAPIVREISGVGAERKGWLRRLLAAMKKFGRRDDDAPARLPPLTSGLPASATSLPAVYAQRELHPRQAPSSLPNVPTQGATKPAIHHPVMSASLREQSYRAD